MLRFLTRRILLALPTVLGIVLITFFLFNVVGGSPASNVLGQNASPQALADFDARGGYDLPLFLGRWTKNRALPDVDFAAAAPSELARWHADPDGLHLAPGAELDLPLYFPLPAGNTWRLDLDVTAGALASPDSLPATFPSDAPPRLVAGPDGATLAAIRLRRATRGLFDSQLVRYFRELAHLDFGISTSLNRPVAAILLAGIGPSLLLTVPILVCELLLSLTLALWCAYFHGRLLDRLLVAVSVAIMSINYIVFIILGQFFLGFKLHLFPVWGFESWANLLLPVLIGTFTGLGSSVRFYRTILLEEMNREYVMTARAKGLPTSRILFRHVLRNALSPVVTNVVLSLPYLYTGSLLLESFFGIPGLGYLSINAINSSDFVTIRAIVLVGAVLCTLANLLADVALAAVDPRVKLS
ncbi:MAG: ABC transporter permease [Kiritimatiellae bacterium]|nr:ABC transporter permease [Kiritimatiellia bacterium]